MNQLSTKPTQHSSSPNRTVLILMLGIALLAANLRAPLTSVGPLVSLMRDSLHISNTLAGMMTTLPLFAFALFSPLVPGLARRFGMERVLFGSVVILAAGILLRSWSGSFGLFLGTAILGLSISVGNVLIPSLIKREFPRQVGVMTGVYTVSMNTFAALASGISIPLAVGLGLGWTGALRIWAVLSLIAMFCWIPQLRRNSQGSSVAGESITREAKAETYRRSEEVKHRNRAQGADAKSINMWKSSLAWQVTLYMGLQSMVFYCMVAWLPDILIQAGMNSGQAGWMLSLMQLALIPMTFVGSVLAGRKASQHSLVTFGSVCVIIGLAGLLLWGGSGLTLLWIIILGIGGGFTFSLAMMLFSLRTENADEAARLSGMAQSIGYLLAAFGPMFFGYLHDLTANWTLPLIILIAVAVLCWLTGFCASGDRYISATVKNRGGRL
ncbi:CP family cyanate transporter-like MFS transporter [Desulfitobacterium sp. LBE]|uniref:CynX/NimT family MFS transporter n=1 Tax=Desulfitobacterium sp. LBE TaxID=884086 RepID=UPI00119B0FA7|nr:MFS transporter [Desulfitobacterium sp. LBE]TWH57518.1 CP family cyanate transporter-like MFS transporter [Desulfitobacterium sp. LBE]